MQPNHKIGMVVEGVLVEGIVERNDGGDWIYPYFRNCRNTYPGWCRSTQVIDLEDK
jgi:hypothetical protein